MVFEILKKEDEPKVIDLIDRTFKYRADESIPLNGDNYKFVVFKEEGEIVATSMLTTIIDPIKNIKKMHIDYFCVDENARERGIGRQFFDEIESLAKQEGINLLELTSNPRRENARRLYLDKNMILLDTNVFIKNIER